MKKVLLMLVLGMFILASCEDRYYDEDENWDDYPDTEMDDENDDDDDNDAGNSSDGGEGSLTLYGVEGDIISKLKDYPVSGSSVSLQQDVDKHMSMWEHVIQLIPGEYRDKIAQFEVFEGGDELLGYVQPLNDGDLSKWKFSLAIDISDGSIDKIDLRNIFTIVTIHEYGHILTLNDEQIQVSSSQSCGEYFTGEGCSRKDSYINKLYNIGWADIIEEHDFDDPYKTYEKYSSRFVSEYAATNPGEDVAEVFTHFVAAEGRPSGNTIADKKIIQMFESSELVILRNKIRAMADLPTLQAITNRTIVMSKFGYRSCGHKNHRTNKRQNDSNN